jgi:hypothetical protein
VTAEAVTRLQSDPSCGDAGVVSVHPNAPNTAPILVFTACTPDSFARSLGPRVCCLTSARFPSNMHANTSSEHIIDPPVQLLSTQSDVLFIEDLAHLLRASRTTIERRRKDRSLPFPELPAIDKRPRWSRRVVEDLMSLTTSSVHRRQPRRPFAPTRMKA